MVSLELQSDKENRFLGIFFKIKKALPGIQIPQDSFSLVVESDEDKGFFSNNIIASDGKPYVDVHETSHAIYDQLTNRVEFNKKLESDKNNPILKKEKYRHDLLTEGCASWLGVMVLANEQKEILLKDEDLQDLKKDNGLDIYDYLELLNKDDYKKLSEYTKNNIDNLTDFNIIFMFYMLFVILTEKISIIFDSKLIEFYNSVFLSSASHDQYLLGFNFWMKCHFKFKELQEKPLNLKNEFFDSTTFNVIMIYQPSLEDIYNPERYCIRVWKEYLQSDFLF